MKIDISINFNDLTPPDNIGMVRGQKPPYYEQLVYLLKSVKLNWDKTQLDYTLYIHHSRPLAKDKQEYLKSLGCTVVYNENEVQPYFCRENILNYKTDGDYTLILDTDMIVLNTPSLVFDREIYVRRADTPGLSDQQWEDAYNRFGMTYVKDDINHFNGGCFLIKNSCKQKMYDQLVSKEGLRILKTLEEYDRHMSVQFYYSLLVKQLQWGLLNKRVNVFSHTLEHTDPERSVDILHYLGTYGYTDTVKNLLNQLKEI